MMGLGSFGGGGPSSSPSSSNLSALAPPFTVDRSNSKHSATPLLQLSESPYATGFGHTWQYGNPAASRPDVYQKSELEADSTNITPMTPTNDYHFRYSVTQSNNTHSNHWSALNPSAKTSTDAFFYDPKVEAYYHPYVSPDEGTPLVALSDPSYDVLPSSGLVSNNASAQVDYTQSLSGLEYTPTWGGVCYGLLDGDAKRGRHTEIDGSFIAEKSNASESVAYTNYLNQGCNVVECQNMPEEDSGSSCRLFSDVIGRESSKLLVGMEHADISQLAQNVLPLPFDSSTASISSSSFTNSESLPPVPSLQSPKNFSNYKNPYNAYGKGNWPMNSCFSTSVSVTKSSPTLVIRPPPVSTGLPSQKSTSGQTSDIIDVASVHQNEGLGNRSPCRGKEPQVLQKAEGVEGSFFIIKPKNHKDECENVFSLSNSVVDGPPSKVQNKDKFSPVLRINSGSQFLNVNTSDGSSSGDSAQAIKSSENFADCLDHHNPAEDSPCWKGAPSSHFAQFDDVETDSSHHFMKKLDECHRLDLQFHPPFTPLHDPIRSPSEKAGKDKVHHEYGSAAPEISADMKKGIPILTSIKGVQFSEGSSKAGEAYNSLNRSKSNSRLQFSDSKLLVGEGYNFSTKRPNLQAASMETVMTVNDNTEGGAVAVRAAENVLCSPSSEESASEQVKPLITGATPKMDVQTLINAMQNLSDLLVFSCSSNESALQEQDHEALKHVITNLDSLLSQRMTSITQQKEPILSRLDNPEKVVEYLHPCKSIGAGKPQFENKASLKLHGQLDYQHYHDEKKAASFQHFPFLMNDFDVLYDDNISQAIRKVLEENSYFGEEEHSQALLFKSLWLEAEAKLYSISYRARFDRTKIEMEKLKSKQVKDVAEMEMEMEKLKSKLVKDVAEMEMEMEKLKSKQVKDVAENVAAPQKSSRSVNLHAQNTSIFSSTDVENVSTQKTAVKSSSSNADDVETSVMARLHMLNCPDDPKPFNLEPQQPADDVEASVMTRFHILKRRDSPNIIIPVGQQANTIQAGYSGKLPCAGDQSVDLVGIGYEPVIDSVTQSPGNSGKRNQNYIGSIDNSTSDWEHVLKEDISWR